MSGQGRNDLCKCGSGKKYKNCCGNRSVKVEQIKDGLLKCLFIALKRNGGKMVFTPEELRLEENWAEKLNIQNYTNVFTKEPGDVILSIKE